MSRLIYAAYFLAAGLACLVIGAVMLRVHIQLGRRLSKHPRADALMALHPRDFEAFLRGVGIRTASDESGWTRSLDELPDPFAEAFGDA